MLKGFRNFLLRGDVIVVAIGLIVALAFSGLVEAFTTDVLKPLIDAAASNGSTSSGLWWTIHGQRIDMGAFVAAIGVFSRPHRRRLFRDRRAVPRNDAPPGDDGVRRPRSDEDLSTVLFDRPAGRGDALSPLRRRRSEHEHLTRFVRDVAVSERDDLCRRAVERDHSVDRHGAP